MSEKPNRRWIWFFAVLTGLTVAAIATLIIYNTRQQLRPPDLEAARQRWQAQGPADYNLEYSVAKQSSERELFTVRVRQGHVEAVALNGRPLEPAQYHYYGIPALFDFIEEFLDQDAQPGKPRTFTKALFDDNDGHVTHYVRRVMGSRERVEINLRLDRVGG